MDWPQSLLSNGGLLANGCQKCILGNFICHLGHPTYPYQGLACKLALFIKWTGGNAAIRHIEGGNVEICNSMRCNVMIHKYYVIFCFEGRNYLQTAQIGANNCIQIMGGHHVPNFWRPVALKRGKHMRSYPSGVQPKAD